MIDLDDALRKIAETDSDWDESRAATLAERIASALGLSIQYERGDEEWAIWHGEGPYLGMVSVRYPIAIVTPSLTKPLEVSGPELTVITIDDFLAEELRASPNLLEATLLRQGCDDGFDPEAFSANDLFVESV